VRARTAVLELLKGSSEWRSFFRACCEASPFRLRSQVWQFRDELAERGHKYSGRGNPELEDALFGLARELMPSSPAARWDEGWAFSLCKDVVARFAEHCAGLTAAEMEALDLSAQDAWDERMRHAGLDNDPAAFRVALRRWEQAGLEALGALRDTKEGGMA
jgi:hypothetical protein